MQDILNYVISSDLNLKVCLSQCYVACHSSKLGSKGVNTETASINKILCCRRQGSKLLKDTAVAIMKTELLLSCLIDKSGVR
jgi:hypothetical protein